MYMLSIFTIVIMCLLTGSSIFLLHRNKNKLANLSGLIVVMVLTMMSGLLAGYISGILSGELFFPVGFGMLIGFILGFIAGQPIGILAILTGSATGVVSGIMGALLGAILQFDNPTIILGILLGVYVIILGLVLIFIIVGTNGKLTLDTKGISPFNILSAGLVLIALFLFLYSSDLVKIPGESEAAQTEENNTSNSAKKTELDITKETNPKIEMMITPTGYTPNVIKVKKGVPVELNITNPGDNSCFSTFMMPDFDLNNVNLKAGTTKLTFTPDKEGEYTFSCGMNMFKGTVIVE
ncbi:cupredoxin domain-containing protein [Neobacillus sp. YX16]|uniref:cupredoxin domain-containing protein n=1 Tax=Neobacillus sp. YX16 TaxID=3047874 RepID=UPI0024C2EC08|nr:cupredoxin domain-containing protein [Neobacillus sp. YX16]WHZ05299.1 cupredoxin domain-containing protein [Neobacillus sp. YX16]